MRSRTFALLSLTSVLALTIFSNHTAQALTAQRWKEIQQYYQAIEEQQNYRPKAGDKCFLSGNDVGWLTPAGKITSRPNS